MIIFYITLFLSWLIMKLLWGNGIARKSLVIIFPLGIYFFIPLINRDIEYAIIISIIYFMAFGVFNLFAWIIFSLKDIDWSNNENRKDFIIGLLGGGISERSHNRNETEKFVIQYRDQVGGSWVNGPSSNDERAAENMFDRFIENNSYSNRRCRLVRKVNGRIKNIMSTN